jgi:protein arginine kinase activator
MKVCSVCGMSFSQVQKEKMFGCPECFYTFEEEVKKAYQNMNINEIYSGSLPKRLKGYKSNLVGRVETQLKLQEAIKNEEYEKAALYRDYLNVLNSQKIENGVDEEINGNQNQENQEVEKGTKDAK